MYIDVDRMLKDASGIYRENWRNIGPVPTFNRTASSMAFSQKGFMDIFTFLSSTPGKGQQLEERAVNLLRHYSRHGGTMQYYCWLIDLADNLAALNSSSRN